MPARNAAKTLEATVDGIPKAWVDEIILVDDSSTDDTVELARKLPLHVVWHPHNVGYGGNQKTCYLEALQRNADVVVMLHPDGQYEPEIIPKLVAPIVAGKADIVLGSRFLDPDGAKEGGMPWWKRAANRFLTTAENRLMGTDLPSCTPATGRSAQGAARGPVPAQLARLRVRHRAADAGRPLRLPLPRGALRDDLQQRGVVGLVPARRRLRRQVAGGRRAPGPAPPGDLAVQEVPGVKRVCVFSGSSPALTSPTAPPPPTSATGSPTAASSLSTAARTSG